MAIQANETLNRKAVGILTEPKDIQNVFEPYLSTDGFVMAQPGPEPAGAAARPRGADAAGAIDPTR